MVKFLKESGPASASPVAPLTSASSTGMPAPQTTPVQPPQPACTNPETDSAPCVGCPGCDSDTFDFGKLDNRELPSYPEQTMTVEEFLQAKQAGLIRD